MSMGARERFPFLSVDTGVEAGKPLYQQLEDQIRAAIREGRLQPGDRVPSTRHLAADLGLSRNTAKAAFNQLIVEGYLVAGAGSGTRVARDLPEQLLQVPSRKNKAQPEITPILPAKSAEKMRATGQFIRQDADRVSRPFRPHTPATDEFPRQLWAGLTTRRARQTSRDLLERVDPRGYKPLRRAVAAYLGSARGVACDEDQVIITAGAQQAIDLIAKILLDPGDVVCMEEPGYTPASQLFELSGATIAPVPVDQDGLVVEQLPNAAGKPKLVYVTPSSQFPLGMTMSLPRRAALIDWAQRTGTVIVEDDYNGEYRYAGRPLPALYGLAPAGRVLYTGSFSKVLFPALRIGFVVVPPDLVDHFAAARWLTDRHSPPLEQAVLTDFIEQGHFARHIRRMRTLYAERQAALVRTAADNLQGIIQVPAADAGMHLIGWMHPGVSETMLLNAASRAGVELIPTSLFRTQTCDRGSVLLGYAPFAEKEIRRATEKLAREIRAQAG